ncbi:MAG TPA: Mov34/MPN/PAD-1 family protein, partial [Candidatus Binataceae bacterium]
MNIPQPPQRRARLRQSTLDEIIAHGEREFPYECCGFVIGGEAVEEVRPIANIQNQKHSEDPSSFP